MSAANLAAYLQRFFTDRLLGQLDVSPHTVASYRDTCNALERLVGVEADGGVLVRGLGSVGAESIWL